MCSTHKIALNFIFVKQENPKTRLESWRQCPVFGILEAFNENIPWHFGSRDPKGVSFLSASRGIFFRQKVRRHSRLTERTL